MCLWCICGWLPGGAPFTASGELDPDGPPDRWLLSRSGVSLEIARRFLQLFDWIDQSSTLMSTTISSRMTSLNSSQATHLSSCITLLLVGAGALRWKTAAHFDGYCHHSKTLRIISVSTLIIYTIGACQGEPSTLFGRLVDPIRVLIIVSRR